MGRKKKEISNLPPRYDPSADWVVSEEWNANGRNLVKGTELSIKGERGRYHFVRHVYNPRADASWIDVIGGPKNIRQYRSFNPMNIKTVHYKNKLRKPKPKGKDVE